MRRYLWLFLAFGCNATTSLTKEYWYYDGEDIVICENKREVDTSCGRFLKKDFIELGEIYEI